MSQFIEGSSDVEAVENLLAEIMTEDYAFPTLRPTDRAGYFDAIVITFNPKRRKSKRVYVEEDGGVWKAKLA